MKGQKILKKLGSAPRILLVRNDGLGDLILTLPLAVAIKAQLPGAHLSALVSRPLIPLVEMIGEFDGVLADEGILLKRHREKRTSNELRLLEEDLLELVRRERFDAALVVYAEGASARLVYRARIPLRAGPRRRIFGWRFNISFGRTRRGSTQAEYELNLGFLPLLGLREEFVFPTLKLPLPPERAGVMLHPYKRNETALSWPLERFVELARAFAAAGEEVSVVGDAQDEPVLAEHFGGLEGVKIHTDQTLAELVGLIAGARLFIGNSSGPLHIAGLTRTPHVGFFPLNRVSAPARWRTLPGGGENAPDPEKYLLAPELDYGCVTCRRERCPHFNCVAGISFDRVRQAIAAWGLEPPVGD